MINFHIQKYRRKLPCIFNSGFFYILLLCSSIFLTLSEITAPQTPFARSSRYICSQAPRLPRTRRRRRKRTKNLMLVTQTLFCFCCGGVVCCSCSMLMYVVVDDRLPIHSMVSSYSKWFIWCELCCVYKMISSSNCLVCFKSSSLSVIL